MTIDIEKINECLKKPSLMEELKKNMSVENIKKQFKLEGIEISDTESEEFRNIVLGLKKKISEDGLESVVGGFGNASGAKDISGALNAVCDAVSRGSGYVIGSLVVGAAKITWGALKLPIELVYDFGKGVYEGGKNACGIKDEKPDKPQQTEWRYFKK
jgi:hypothetical protein